MLDNVDLMEEDERVEDGKGGIIQYASQYHVLQILQAVSVMDLLLDIGILNPDYLLEPGCIR